MHSPTIVGFGLVLLCNVAWADELYELVRYRCDSKQNALSISHVVAYNEKGRQMQKRLGPDEWNPWQMLKTKDESSIVIGVESVNRTCALTDGTYEVTITPDPCNSDLQGLYGGMMRVNVTVQKNQKRLVFEHFGYCAAVDTNVVTTSVSISSGDARPRLVHRKIDDFFRVW